MSLKKLTKKQKRQQQQRQQQGTGDNNNGGNQYGGGFININSITPLTVNQKRVFDAYENGKNLLLHGTAGTGKSFISLYLALNEVLNEGQYEKVVIVRSVVPSREMGFLPGNQKEKVKVYEAPYYAICTELFGRGDAYDLLKHKNRIEFISTSFIRGTTLSDCIVVVDEVQNMTASECNTIITRVGQNCKIIFCGDIRQTDLNKGRETSGLGDFVKIIKRMSSFELVEFEPEDICRSKMVKQYIMIRNELEDQHEIQSLSKL